MKRRVLRWLAKDESIASPAQRATHTYVVGQPGTGKSRALESWAMQDILAGRGVGVIDPHGDLFRNLVGRIALRPSLWERVIIIDPTDAEWAVNIDPLQALPSFSQQRLALFLTDIIVKIWGINPAHAPRMVWLLANSFLALADLGLTLLDLPRFLLDRSYRESLLPRVTREEVLTYFHLEFPKSEGGIRQWVTPVLNKIGGLIFDPDIRLMLGGGRPLNFRQVIDTQRVLLVNLSKGILGDGTSALLGAFLVAQLQKAALARADSGYRPAYHLYLDEFQNYTTDNIKDVLSESRKYTLSLTLAHQYLDQLTPELRDAVLHTSGTLVSFRVGYQDAVRLAKEVFPSSEAATRSELVPRPRLGVIPRLTLEVRQQPGGWDRLAGSLASLPYRWFWSRWREARQPVLQRTLDMQNPRCPREVRSALVDASGARYARPKRDLRRELAARRYDGSSGVAARHPAASDYTAPEDPDNGRDGPALWSE